MTSPQETLSARCVGVSRYMRPIVVLFALLFYWKLTRVIPELDVYPEALAWCRWNGDWDALADVMRDRNKRCIWLLAGFDGNMNWLRPYVGAAVRWLVDFASLPIIDT